MLSAPAGFYILFHWKHTEGFPDFFNQTFINKKIWSSEFVMHVRVSCLIYQRWIVVDLPWQSPFVQGFHVWVRIKFFYGVYAWLGPFSSEHHHSADHSRNAGGVGDCLRTYFTVTFLMVADIVDISSFFFAVFLSGEDTADIRFSYGSRSQGCRIWKESFLRTGSVRFLFPQS